MKRSAPIGIFDSGLGGLTLYRAIRELLPEESIVYLGDGVNCPYGLRSNEEIEQLTDRAVGQLVQMGCKMVVVACNTATAAAIDFLREKYTGHQNIPIVGMEPAVKPACQATKSGVVGVIATQRSLEGDLFQRTAAQYASNVDVVAVFGEGFVEIVENSKEDSAEAEVVVRKVVEPMLEKGVDQIVLGCTHYPFLTEVIQRVAPGVQIVDPSPAVARRVEQLLEQHNMRAQDGPSDPELQFVTFADEAYREKLIEKAKMVRG